MISVIPMPNAVKIITDATYKYTINDIKKREENGHGDEGYRLVVDGDGISVFASTPHGQFNAEMTIKQLLLAESLPNMEIIDAPRYSYRGYMLDCSRHFFSVETIKKQLDALSLVKINVFHWHLTDDQGWRLASVRYPYLTSVGAKRQGTVGDSQPIDGYYSQEDIAEVVAYAKERFIEVVPEIDVPGHMTAAIAAYPTLGCKKEPLKVAEYFGIHDAVACCGAPETYEFFYNLLNEVCEMFPSQYIHLGGDEALRYNAIGCPKCQEMIKKQGLRNEEELQAYFMSKLTNFLRQKGKKVINWNDGMCAKNIPSDIITQYWKESADTKKATIRHINNGASGIMSPFYSYYLDYPYAMTSLKKAYNFTTELKGIEKKEGIIGVEAPLWTEYVASVEQLEFMTYPRVFAVAESGWSNENAKNYSFFVKRLKNVASIFDKVGIRCATIKESNLSITKVYKLVGFFINSFRGSKGTFARMNKNKREIKAHASDIK